MTPIPHSRPWITDEDVAAVSAVLRSERLAMGETRARFERAVAHAFGVPQPGIAVGSGSAALEVALRALGLTPGDEVIIPTYGCTSVVEAVRATGASTVPCDVGEHWLMTPDAVAPWMTRRTRAIVVTHLYGFFAETEAFAEFGVPIVEDFAQAFPVPGERSLRGTIGICSFHPTKCLTTGQGGMVLTRNDDLAARVRRLAMAPMSDVVGALGLTQLARYPAAVARRRHLASRYRAELERTCDGVLARHPVDGGVRFRFPISFPRGLAACEAAFAARGVTVRRGVDRLAHRDLRQPDTAFACAVRLLETTVSLPIYPALDDDSAGRCVRAAVDVCGTIGATPQPVEAR